MALKVGEAQKRKLFESARGALDNSYCPYSDVRVAAAVLDNRGEVFTGVNIENVSFGLTICAERSAVFTAIGSGAKHIKALLITSSHGAIPPCGACRQVLAEFASSDMPVFLADGSGIVEETTIGTLLPKAFGASDNWKV